MIIFKCKMCGGDLHPIENATTCECEYCGSVQTIPMADNEKKMNLFGRAQRLLRACEFDKAAGVYESIVAEFPEEAEAYWGLVLCKYGIEYVDDPVTGKKVPTCHRSSFDSVMEDSNFEQACENADSVARRVYRDEAKAIEELRKRIIEVSGKEEPYDIFICYKETDEKGDRTLDSVLAQDIYDALTEKGYRVFFSRITLEDKLGQEYEPYIFAALNSAKVMLVVGTDYEYFNAVWVKNEWSRFLKLITAGEKKTLIPCYKGIDAYDMPKEFARLQAQDMSKVGAMQDLRRGIEKIIQPKMNTDVENTPIILGVSNSALIDRGFMALAVENWDEAKDFFEQALNIDAKCSNAYLGLAMANYCCKDQQVLMKKIVDGYIVEDINLNHALDYADKKTRQLYNASIEERNHKSGIIQNKRDISCNIAEMSTMYSGIPIFINLDGTITIPGLRINEKQNIPFLEESRRERLRDIQNDSIKLNYSENFKRGLLEKAEQEYTQDYYALEQLIHADNIRSIGVYRTGDIGKSITAPMVIQLDGTIKVLCPNAQKEIVIRKIEGLKNVKKVYGSYKNIYVLHNDGTVISTDSNNNPKLENVIDFGHGDLFVVIKEDGRIDAFFSDKSSWMHAKDYRSFDNWGNITAVYSCWGNTIGITKDGSVLYSSAEKASKLDVHDWKDIAIVKMFGNCAFGLNKYGHVVSTGEIVVKKANKEEQHISVEGLCNDWTDIINISVFDTTWTGNMCTCVIAGLRLDGTVTIKVIYEDPAYSVSPSLLQAGQWNNVVAIKFLSGRILLGIKADGSIVYTGELEKRLAKPSALNEVRLFNDIETIEQDREKMIREHELKKEIEKAEQQAQEEKRRRERINSLKNERNQLTEELNNLKGLFKGKRRKEIELQLAQIESELQRVSNC